jgi:hypothetical protein
MNRHSFYAAAGASRQAPSVKCVENLTAPGY